MRYPKYKLAFPGKHVWIFNGKPMTQFDGYTLNTTAIGDGIVSANKLKGFYGDSAQIFLSAAPHNSFSAFSSQYGTIDGMTYYFGKHDDVLSAYFIAENMRNVLLEQTLGGRISAIPMTGYDGTEVILSNIPSSHWNFNGYEITGATLSGNKFLFNGSDVTARALWNEDAKYNIVLIQTNGGRISANKLTGYSGDIITLSNTPSSHYTFNSYGITGAELTGNQFRIVGNVSANASWIQDQIYNVILSQKEGGIITAIPMTGYAGDVITFSSNTSAHYTQSGYYISPGGWILTNTATMPNQNLTAAGVWIPDETYTLTLQQSVGGTISANKLTGFPGDIITLFNTPSSTYYLTNYSITGATLTGNQFKFGTSDVTAAGSFAQGIAGPVRFSAAGEWTPTANADYIVDNIGPGPRDFNVQIDSLPCIVSSMNVPQAWIKNINGSSFFIPEETNYKPCSSNYTLGYGSKCNMSGDVPIYCWYDISGNSALSSESNFRHDTGRERLWMADIGYRNLEPHGQVGSHGIGWFTSVGTISTIESVDADIKYHWNNVPKMSASLSAFHWKVNYNGEKYNVSFKYNSGYNWWGVDGYYTTIKPPRVLTINSVAGGNVSASRLTATDDEIITLSQTANSGYTFNNYSITGATLTGNQFKFNGQNVTVQPNFTHNVYTLTFQNDGHGTVTSNKTTGYYNDTTTLTATPKQGYSFASYSITGGSITNNTYRWTTANGIVKPNWTYTGGAFNPIVIGSQTAMGVDLDYDDGGKGISALDIIVNGVNYGKTYFYTPAAAQRVANKINGWHLPDYNEWSDLISNAGGMNDIGGLNLRSVSAWSSPGRDVYGMNIMPVGDINDRDAHMYVGKNAEYFTTTKYGNYYKSVVFGNSNGVGVNYFYYKMGPVRLFKDS